MIRLPAKSAYTRHAKSPWFEQAGKTRQHTDGGYVRPFSPPWLLTYAHNLGYTDTGHMIIITQEEEMPRGDGTVMQASADDRKGRIIAQGRRSRSKG